ncbi:MAG: BRCT domain-containing protein [Gammaproteobacteria bacterium]|jgi:NAD-dependent DNA ligase|nr:BRCT domain-containing protein [Gammaproteobacteria bacterium]
MNTFTRFNRKNIDDRQIDTLIGLSKGLMADGKVDQLEAEVLLTWLIQSRAASENPIIHNLYERVHKMLSDNVLDDEESKELMVLLSSISSDQSEIGEIAKTSTLPLCSPAPQIEFIENNFLFTGTFAFGTRAQCIAAVESLGGKAAKTVTKSVNYLVLGSYVTDSWAHENFGRKIEKAMEYRSSGVPLAIVSEEHWANCRNIQV